MARSQRTAEGRTIQITDLSVCKGSSKPPSMLYSMLPAFFQTRLPKLRSIRQSVLELRSGTNMRPSVKPSSTGRSTPQSSFSSCAKGGDLETGSILSYDEDIPRERLMTRERSLSSSSTLPVFPMTEANSGINWKYASQGSNLLNQAFEESSAVAALSDGKVPSFCRDLYIHALMYLLRALPDDLNQSEQMSIQSSLPAPIVKSIEATVMTKNLVPYRGKGMVADEELQPPPPSIIQRAVAAVIIQFFVVMQFLLPYVKVFISSAYHYEREHRISERVFSSSIDTIDGIGKRSIQLADRICAMNDGKVGQALNNFTIWWVTGITGGIHQGIQQGIIVLKEDPRRRSPVEERSKVKNN